ncbi:MAG: alpha/beta hydrolase [Clostridium sp.]|nr:alpha/beta hydrolase [Clostridium sp.]
MKEHIFNAVKWIMPIVSVSVVASLTWNFLCRKSELSKIQSAYGQELEVAGLKMVADVKGQGNEPTIILLPGWGSASPVLEFLPLAKALAENFCVITIEPFGYGLSDENSVQRDISIIVEELHECTQKLGCKEYYLMAHSISGLYSLYWTNKYPQEVKGFIGIDPSVPKQSDHEPFPVSVETLNKLTAYLQQVKNIFGITRLKSIRKPQKAIYADDSYVYTKEELSVFRILSMDFVNNKTVMNELDCMEANLEVVREMKFPKDIPVLQFVSGDNCELMKAWEQLHREVITETDKSEVLRLDGGHYLHYERKQEVIGKVKKWVQKVESL